MPRDKSVLCMKSSFVPEQITIKNRQFARFVSRRTGVSSKALSSAVNILTKGLVDAMAEGYNVQLIGLGIFQVRVMPPRKRWHRVEKRLYMAPPFLQIHFKKSQTFIDNVKEKSIARMEGLARTPTIPPVTTGKGAGGKKGQ